MCNFNLFPIKKYIQLQYIQCPHFFIQPFSVLLHSFHNWGCAVIYVTIHSVAVQFVSCFNINDEHLVASLISYFEEIPQDRFPEHYQVKSCTHFCVLCVFFFILSFVRNVTWPKSQEPTRTYVAVAYCRSLSRFS